MDPIILFFALGVAARFAKSDLRLPEVLYETLSIYLLLAIGLKGGAQLAQQPIGTVLPQAIVAVVLGAAIPFALYPVLRRVGKLPRPDSAAVAAHYGSVSVVTFAVGWGMLSKRNIAVEPYLPLLLALMEAPGIVSGVLLARLGHARQIAWAALAREVLLGRSIVLVLGGLLIGALAGPDALAPMDPLFKDLFSGVLALFLLEMGLITGGRLGDLRRVGIFLIGFGIGAPLALGLLGAMIGHHIGLSLGGATLLATLSASASYIAAPAAMRLAVPEANPVLSIGLALGVTFPFNITIGIPVYLYYARWLGS